MFTLLLYFDSTKKNDLNAVKLYSCFIDLTVFCYLLLLTTNAITLSALYPFIGPFTFMRYL